METVDRRRITSSLYPHLRERSSSGASTADIENVIACAAEGYPFPTNLDLDQPVGGLTPPSQADLVHRALAEDWEPARLDAELADHDSRRRTDG